MCLIVPNYVSEAINAAIDKALAGRACETGEREHIYQLLLAHFDVHGVIPDFNLTAK